MPFDTAALVISITSLVAALGSCLNSMKVRARSPCFDMQLGSTRASEAGSAIPSPVVREPPRKSLTMP